MVAAEIKNSYMEIITDGLGDSTDHLDKAISSNKDKSFVTTSLNSEIVMNNIDEEENKEKIRLLALKYNAKLNLSYAMKEGYVPSISCIAYAPPPNVSENLADCFRDDELVLAIINAEDPISRWVKLLQLILQIILIFFCNHFYTVWPSDQILSLFYDTTFVYINETTLLLHPSVYRPTSLTVPKPSYHTSYTSS